MPTAEQHDARQVEPAHVGGELRDEPGGEDEPDDADRHVDEEDPLPAEPVDEHAAEDRPDQRGDAPRPRPTGSSPGRATRPGTCG